MDEKRKQVIQRLKREALERVKPYNTMSDKMLLYWWYHTDEGMFGEELFFIGEELKARGYSRVPTADGSGEMWDMA